MPPDLRLGYLVFEVRRPSRWTAFCARMLGLPAPSSNTDGSLGWQLDDACQRLIAQEGPADDLAAIGLECASDEVMDRMVRRLQQAGRRVTAGDAALCGARRVRRLHRCADPCGNAIELFTGAAAAAAPFASAAFPQGFRTGDLGLGHAVLVAHDLEAMEAFYVGLLGFGVTERLATRVGPIDIRGTFLHCNQRHHSLALFDMPLAKRIHHFMLQAERLSDIGVAFERARRHKVPLSLELGQHPDPDGTFSFYGVTPSGFDFEIGAGTQTIEPAGWETHHTDVTSAWGHKPKLRLQLKMAAGLIARKMGAASQPAKELS
ncbi:VOC family protein [Variovorax saccharolyticus]|uniref:VOC family protein n=1 Tax=Variovorax saccharolyticus TaxID=3053516 RepID=UPI0025781ED8|nr:VOC family protein [Variovorax sp. J31P216]MDM0027696.1 VOC family protein [Variovorax sp. J31P216]